MQIFNSPMPSDYIKKMFSEEVYRGKIALQLDKFYQGEKVIYWKERTWMLERPAFKFQLFCNEGQVA